jgi:hypothetical protein
MVGIPAQNINKQKSTQTTINCRPNVYCACLSLSLLVAQTIEVIKLCYTRIIGALCAPYSSSCGGPAAARTQGRKDSLRSYHIVHEKTCLGHYHTIRALILAHFAHQWSRYAQPQEGSSPPLLSFLRNDSPVLY